MRRGYFYLIAVSAAVGLLLSGCSSGQSTGNVTENSDGTYTAECSADCAVVEQNLDYTVSLKVTTDADGNILKVEDNGTTIPDDNDGAYKNAEALFSQLEGKNSETLSGVDAVSGATYSSNAILKAVKEGLDAIDQNRQ